MIRGTKRVTSPRACSVQASIHNRFDIEVLDAETGEVKQKAQALNTVCTNLWSRIFSKSTYFNYIHYGTGTGTPSYSDTSLFAYLGNASATYQTYKLDYSAGVFYVRKYIQLSASTAVGKTLTEVGIAHSTSTTSLCTHALLKDMNGNPISIQKTDTDVVNIYATVYVHFNPAGYDNGSISLICYENNITYFFLSFLAGHISYPLNYGMAFAGIGNGNSAVYSPPVGVLKSVTTVADSSTKTLTLTLARLETSDISSGGFDRIFFHCSRGSDYNYMGMPSIIISPGGNGFPYSEVASEAVGTGDGITTDFALDFPWARDVKVYVDGVETVDFSVDYAPIRTPYTEYCIDPLLPNSTSEHHSLEVCTYSRLGSGIYYNRCWEIGLASVKANKGTAAYQDGVYVSNDLVTWTKIANVSSSVTVTIPEEYRHYKYWRFYPDYAFPSSVFTLHGSYAGKALHFNTAPQSGAVITADYKCDCFAKDSNHVFDFSLVIQLGEYTEA